MVAMAAHAGFYPALCVATAGLEHRKLAKMSGIDAETLRFAFNGPHWNPSAALLVYQGKL